MGIFTIQPVPFPAATPSTFLPMTWLTFFVAYLPALSCYFCIGSTLVLQQDVISNYSLSNCPHVKSPLPPISYSIGVWEPQKLVWLFALMLHLPARIILTMTVPQVYLPGLGKNIMTSAATFEALGLMCVSIFSVDSIIGFHAHASFFVVWWAAAMWSMGIIIHLQRLIGQKDTDPYIHRMWWIKIALMSSFFAVSVGASVFYPLSQIHCSVTAFTIFCLCEWSVVGLNAAFWGCYLTEIAREFEGFQVTAIKPRKGNLTEGTITPIDVEKKIENTLPGAVVVKVAY
ncbi:hypothetical protein PRIPAC_81009 [Pristionchus pacificus]|uniref:CWH43-like N-terminal domain-containing protein n=1 Tax=Pristionchus pacificus TaxID=54126 RepID=A0A2A6C3J1_PRIPA|nr:hypothetical protein PRIPAC_81009 [Pristionchus pacificus]|eukprot:PDM72668.1 hypothetical protein PRIPAC_39102 [Pristionchus pacificus]